MGEGSTLVHRSLENEQLLNDRPFSDPYKVKPGEKPYKMEIVWKNVFGFIYLHFAAIYAFTYPIPRSPFLVGMFMAFASTYGIAAGAHRYWAHKSFKANKKLHFLLMICQTIAGQNSLIEWVRDHRVHHKYSDTNADPHNATRGFFFAHIGWLMCKKHPDVRKYGSRVDMSDLESDPLLRFQHKYYMLLMALLSFILPISLTSYIFDAPVATLWHWNIFRYVIVLHATWLTNSASHMPWGAKPYDKSINPSDTYIIGIIAFGEGWHNFHHVYPWDYKVSELPRYWCNFTIPFIDFFAWLGWATDLKTVSDEIIRKRVLRTGDGSHPHCKNDNGSNNNNEVENEPQIWGWGKLKENNRILRTNNFITDDKDMDAEERSDVKILHKKFDN